MSTLEKYSQDLEDLLDGLIAESRKEDKKCLWKMLLSI